MEMYFTEIELYNLFREKMNDEEAENLVKYIMAEIEKSAADLSKQNGKIKEYEARTKKLEVDENRYKRYIVVIFIIIILLLAGLYFKK